MKKPYLAPVLALVIGAFAAALRWNMLATAFEPDTGLMKNGEVSVMLLCAITGAVLLGAAVFALCLGKRYAPADTFQRGYKNNSVTVMGLSVLAGLAVAAGGVLGFLGDMERSVTDTVLYALAAASGLCIVVLSVTAYTGKENSFAGIANITPSLYFVCRLALCYRDNAAEPAVLSYCFFLMTLAAASVSFYYAAGFYYGRAKVFGTAVSHLLGVYFCCMALGEGMGLTETLIAAGTLVYLFFSSASAMRNFKRVKIDDVPVK